MAEIKRKEAMSQRGRGGISFCVRLSFDRTNRRFQACLAMSLVLLLNHEANPQVQHISLVNS
uniref:Uncharacterized protein n=1 Tax=Nelumbo nucifera TaxID=4432 RepID=A0A822ZBP0_NELNU|nr:TPA_asm: hypothetical protein HUJ06_013280 [Nelumbo nucifera]